jgi:hypothetical protein
MRPNDPLPLVNHALLQILTSEAGALYNALHSLTFLRRGGELMESHARAVEDLPERMAFYGSLLLDVAGRDDGLPLRKSLAGEAGAAVAPAVMKTIQT